MGDTDTPDDRDGSSLRALRRANRLAAERVRAARLEFAEKRERRRALRESAAFDWVTPYAELLDLTRRTGDPVLGGPTSPWQRRQGKNWPIYQTEQELNLLRAPARLLMATGGYAQGLAGGLSAYVVSTGYSYRPAKKHKRCPLPDDVIDAAQVVIDEILAHNQWRGGEQPGLEVELFLRSLEDGEWILTHYPRADGLTDFRTQEPECLTQPPGTDFAEWGFGIETPRDDAQSVKRYYVQHGDSPGDGDEYAPDELTHHRRNVRRSQKRGLTDFSFDVFDTLSLSSKLRTNLGDSAAQQAAIVYVRQHENATSEDVQAFLGDDADYTQTDLYSGAQTPVKVARRGGREDIPKGMSYVDGPGAPNAPNHLQILQACLRGAGVKWNAPEWLVSGDASNNNYASSLTAESPFVRRVLQEQGWYGESFKKPIWYAFKHYVTTRGLRDRTGRVWSWDEIGHELELRATAPSPETRNKLEEAQRAQIEIPLGAQSRQKYAEEQGRDWDQVAEDNRAYQDETGGDGGQLPMPGEEGGSADARTQDGKGGAQANDLKGTVGGMQAIQSAQTAFYAGEIPRAAAIANMRVVFGFSQEQAEMLFPDVKPVNRTENGQQQQQAAQQQAPPPEVQTPAPTDPPADPTPALESLDLLEDHGPPPHPGLSFDESKHRWVNPHTGETHAHADAPPDHEVLADLGPAPAAVPPTKWAKVKDAVLTATGRLHAALRHPVPAVFAVLDLAKDVLDNPEDLNKWGGMYQANVGVAGPQAATDHVRNWTGDATGGVGAIGTHLALSIASKVLAKGLVYARKKFAGGKVESEDGDGVAGAAEILTDVLSRIGESLGLKLDGRKVAGLLRELAAARHESWVVTADEFLDLLESGEVRDVLEAGAGLVPKKITVTLKSGKTYTKTVMVKPAQAAGAKPAGKKKADAKDKKAKPEVKPDPKAAKAEVKAKALGAAKAAIADPASADPKELAAHLASLTAADITALNNAAGAKGGKLKQEKIDKFLAHLKDQKKAAQTAAKSAAAKAAAAKKEPAPQPPAPAPTPEPESPVFTPEEDAALAAMFAPEPPAALVGKADKGGVEKLVGAYLAAQAVGADQVAGKGKAINAIVSKIKAQTDGSVGYWEVDYALKNLVTQQATDLLAPQFAKGGASNKANADLPDASRPKLTRAEQVAVQKYTGSAYADLNRALRDGKQPADAALHAGLQSAFAKAKKLHPPVAAKRGLTIHGSALDAFVAAAQHAQETGTVAAMPGYLSTSVSSAGIAHFSGTVELHINATHGLDCLPYTHYPHEKELLLDHNSRFKVTAVKKNEATGKWEIHLDQHPPGEGEAAKVTIDDKFKKAGGNPSAAIPKAAPKPHAYAAPLSPAQTATSKGHAATVAGHESAHAAMPYLYAMSDGEKNALKQHLGLPPTASTKTIYDAAKAAQAPKAAAPSAAAPAGGAKKPPAPPQPTKPEPAAANTKKGGFFSKLKNIIGPGGKK